VTATTMTRDEREGLQRLVRQRERVLKSAAKQRSRELIADFENQMGQRYSFDQDETWDKAKKLAQSVVNKAQGEVGKRCRELGIPDRFAPSLSLHWHDSGYDNTLKQDMTRLRRMAVDAGRGDRAKSRRRDRGVLSQGAGGARARQPRLGRGEAVCRAVAERRNAHAESCLPKWPARASRRWPSSLSAPTRYASDATASGCVTVTPQQVLRDASSVTDDADTE